MFVFYIWAGIIALLILSVYLGLCYLLKKKPGIKGVLFAVTSVFGFFLYLFGYTYYFNASDLTGYIKSALRALFSVLRMYFMNDDYSVISTNAELDSVLFSPIFQIPFWACHILAPITTVLAVIAVFGKKLRSMLRTLFSTHKERYIIYGVNSKSLCLAQNIMTGDDGKNHMKDRRLVIFIDENADDICKEKIEKIGAIILDETIFTGDSINEKAIHKAGLRKHTFHKSVYVFAFSDSEIVNSVITSDVLQYAEKCNFSNEYLKGIFVHTDSDMIINDLEVKLKLIHENRRYSLKYFCEEELSARKLFIDKPLYKCLNFDSNTGLPLPKEGLDKPRLTFMILGFGVCGRHILRKAIMNAQFEGCEFKAIVLDCNMNALKGEFINRYPGFFDKECPNHIDIEFKPMNVGSVNFYKLLDNSIIDMEYQQISKIDYIVSCLGDDHKNLEVISDIKSYFIRKSVIALPAMVAHIADNKYQLLSTVEDEIEKITVYGSYDSIFTHEIVVGEEMDRLAKIVNLFAYKDKEWKQLTTLEKNSNRAVASFMGAYLYIMGFELVNGEQKRKLEEKGTLVTVIDERELVPYFEELKKQSKGSKVTPILDNLGITEHLRWNAFHFANGWTLKPLNEVKDNDSRKDTEKKRHACLVSWEGLKQLGEILCYDKNYYTKYNRANVANIYEIIKEYNKKDIPEHSKLYIIRSVKQ